jgi:hypothetical protein
VFLNFASSGGPAYAGVELFGHPVGLINEAIIMAISGLLMLVLAVWAFTNQEG